MLLTITNSGDVTADYLLERLAEESIPFVRFDTDTVLKNVSFAYEPGQPRVQIEGDWHRPEDFSTVWYRRPEKLVSHISGSQGPEAACSLDEWSESLEGFFAHIPSSRWINYPAANALASRKLEQLTSVQQFGFKIPESIVTQDPETLRSFFRRHQGEIIVKPMGRAYIERPDEASDTVIFTNQVNASELDDLADLCECPTLFQQEIRKVSDVRITVVDSDVHAFELMANDDSGRQRCDIRRNNMADVEYRKISLPKNVSSAVHELMAFYRLRFAAIDMAVADDGTWYFFEVNPNGQWAWLDLCGVADIYKSFVQSIAAATR